MKCVLVNKEFHYLETGKSYFTIDFCSPYWILREFSATSDHLLDSFKFELLFSTLVLFCGRFCPLMLK